MQVKRLIMMALAASALSGCGGGDEAPEAPPLRFVETAREAGIDFVSEYRDGHLNMITETMGGGAAWLDYDNDGDWDLYITTGRGLPNALYQNNGDGTFNETAEQAGVNSQALSMGAAAADYNGDGNVDLFVTNYGAVDILYRNNGDGTFTDKAAEAGVEGGAEDWSSSAAWADFDNDGDLDLYVARYLLFHEEETDFKLYPAEDVDYPPTLNPYQYPPQANALYRNDGGGRFAEIAQEAGVEDVKGKGLGAIFCDYDNDGDPDLFVANDVSVNVLFKNNGGAFENVSFLTGLDDPRQGMGIDFGDYDNDGDFDLFATYWIDEMNGFYRNNAIRADAQPSDSFDDIAPEIGLGAPSVGFTGWGTVFADFDLDGDLDIFYANGHTSPDPAADPSVCAGQRAQVFRNDGGRYIETPDALGFGEWGAGRGLAAADYDNDGDEDVLIVQNNGRVLLFRNESGGWNRCVKVRAPIGSRIEARVGNRRIVREIRAGSSYLSTNAPETLIAVPSGGVVEEIKCLGESLKRTPAGSAAAFYADGRKPSVEKISGD